MGGVVGEVEPALQRVRDLLRVGKSPETGLLEPGELIRVRRFLAERLIRPAKVLKRGGHDRRLSATVWVAPAPASRRHYPASRVGLAPGTNRSWERPCVRALRTLPPGH